MHIYWITAWLRYNSHVVKLILLKCTIQWLFVCSQSCTTITTINLRTFLSPPKETPYLLIVTPISLNAPGPRAFVCLFTLWWTFGLSGLLRITLSGTSTHWVLGGRHKCLMSISINTSAEDVLETSVEVATKASLCPDCCTDGDFKEKEDRSADCFLENSP